MVVTLRTVRRHWKIGHRRPVVCGTVSRVRKSRRRKASAIFPWTAGIFCVHIHSNRGVDENYVRYRPYLLDRRYGDGRHMEAHSTRRPTIGKIDLSVAKRT